MVAQPRNESKDPADGADDASRTEDITIEGTLLGITFESADTGFVVGRFEVEGELFPVTAVGEMFAPQRGDAFLLTGAWTEHPRFGRQFRFRDYEILQPTTVEGVERYLASGLVGGIGRSLAARIARHFGADALRIMDEEPARLMEVTGIGEKKLAAIRASWERQRGVQSVMLFLKSHGVGTAHAVRIHRTYGTQAPVVIRADPYALVTDVEGIGFATADRIAHSLGLDAHDDRRLRAGAVHVLHSAARGAGHCVLPREEFAAAARTLLRADEEHVLRAASDAVTSGRLGEDADGLWLPELLAAEESIASALARLHAHPPQPVDHRMLDEVIRGVEHAQHLEFSAQQVEAMHKLFGGPVTILTGGPGTGKTTAIIGMLRAAAALGLTTAICAPTGRAARRIAELTGAEAKTIHRLLEIDARTFTFQRDAANPLEADIVIADEVSMIDAPLMSALLEALRSGCRLLLAGDADQLPSVGPGAVLRDLLESGAIDTVTLHLVFRQAAHSSIVTNAHRVREGFAPVFDEPGPEPGQTYFVESARGADLAALIADLVVRSLPRETGCDPKTNIQVLSPMHAGNAGVQNLNTVLQRALNGDAPVLLRRGDRVFRAGDKVMQMRNDYEKDVFNGDIGLIRGRDDEDGDLLVDMAGRTIRYAGDSVDDLALAYAATVHKSQGGEYDIVILPLTMQHRIMLRRPLLYTGMTRAKRMLVIAGEPAALAAAVRTAGEGGRRTGLRARVASALR
jgi:exodeoxyribonuclease V alpha subunit